VKIRVLGIDAALKNVGIAVAEMDVSTLDWSIADIQLVQTTRGADLKVVRQNSDDLRRAREIHQGVTRVIKDWAITMAVAEIPTGAQDSRAATSFGIAVGILSSLPVPLIEVQPGEVQKQILGFRGRDKEAIIDWAVESWPDLPWKRRMFRGALRLVNDNEHMADACAILKTGFATQQFQQAIALMRAGTMTNPYPLAA
jgi:Holliday junction resolvasome RuvABC endonuclease subunit